MAIARLAKTPTAKTARTSTQKTTKTKPSTPLEHLKSLNPNLDKIIKENPGVLKLINKFEAAGAIAQPQPGEAASQVKFALWTHSKRSGGMSSEPFKEVIFVWRNDPTGKAKLDFGGYSNYQGKLLAVHRLDEFSFSSAASAKATDAKSPGAKEFEPGKFALISTDGGWEWQSMVINAHGKKGDNFDVNWAIVTVDANGNINGGGYPGGWGGRTAQGTFGQDTVMKMP